MSSKDVQGNTITEIYEEIEFWVKVYAWVHAEPFVEARITWDDSDRCFKSTLYFKST